MGSLDSSVTQSLSVVVARCFFQFSLTVIAADKETFCDYLEYKGCTEDEKRTAHFQRIFPRAPLVTQSN